MLQDLPDVLEIEVSPEGQWKPTSGRYAWTNLTDPLLPPLPEPIQVACKSPSIVFANSVKSLLKALFLQNCSPHMGCSVLERDA